ncbi:transposase [Streptomyces sp. NPDC096030]|uniref:transposase n=1 Tax=Streptomyces sp. NPDC096030 TaxID=3155423 RepID=UPI003330F21C
MIASAAGSDRVVSVGSEAVPMQPKGLSGVPGQTAAVARAAFPGGSLPVRIRDHLAGVSAGGPFAGSFGVRGAPGMSPAVWPLVTVLQFAGNLTDRQAAQAVRARLSRKYALGRELTDSGFGFTVLGKFRTRAAGHGLERVISGRLVEHCRDAGLAGAGGRQRTDATRVICAVRDLNRLELAGESVRAALEALAVAAPAWLAGQIGVAGFAHRYGPGINGWTMPSSQARRDRLAQVSAQGRLRDLPGRLRCCRSRADP